MIKEFLVYLIVAGNDKQRFEIRDQQPPMIRALQGHTLKGVEPDLDPGNVGEIPYAVHGTYHQPWNGIKSHGSLSSNAAKARAHYISKSLSELLRHTAKRQGVAIDEQGWVLMSDVVNYLNQGYDKNPWEGGLVTEDEIHPIVAGNAGGNEKKRFETWDGPPSFIRAVQGHTLKGVEPDLKAVNVGEVPYAVHGTYYQAWDRIKSHGLSKMSRNYIHLAKDLPGESGVISGMRGNCEVLIWVDLAKASAAGIKFEQSANGVILTKGNNGSLCPEFFCKVVDRKTNSNLL
jgi:RNA:NAD 2'-phosphotransferase (TPT1/KptA family)